MRAGPALGSRRSGCPGAISGNRSRERFPVPFPGAMFRRPPRNFRGRRRAASSGSSEDEPQPEPREEPAAAPSPDSGASSPPEREAEPGEAGGDPPAEEPARSPRGRAGPGSGPGQRPAGAAAGPGRAGRELLSFGGEEEREGEEGSCVCVCVCLCVYLCVCPAEHTHRDRAALCCPLPAAPRCKHTPCWVREGLLHDKLALKHGLVSLVSSRPSVHLNVSNTGVQRMVPDSSQ